MENIEITHVHMSDEERAKYMKMALKDSADTRLTNLQQRERWKIHGERYEVALKQQTVGLVFSAVQAISLTVIAIVLILK